MIIMLGAGLVILITAAALILRRFNRRRFSLAFATGHLVLIVLVSFFYFFFVPPDAQRELFWVAPVAIDFPVSMPAMVLASGSVPMLALFLAMLGSCQYAFWGWLLDLAVSKNRRELLPGKKTVMTLAAVALILGFWTHRNLAFLKKNDYKKSQIRLNRAKAKLDRFYALNEAAKESFSAGKYDEAKAYAEELLSLAEKYPDDWNYGNAVFDAHLVLGRSALVNGDIDLAKEHLLSSGRTPGSPQLDSFGPNMSLAKDLLERNEKDAVLEFFDLCEKFWDPGCSEIPQWRAEINAGRIPDFGANLHY